LRFSLIQIIPEKKKKKMLIMGVENKSAESTFSNDGNFFGMALGPD